MAWTLQDPCSMVCGSKTLAIDPPSTVCSKVEPPWVKLAGPSHTKEAQLETSESGDAIISAISCLSITCGCFGQ